MGMRARERNGVPRIAGRVGAEMGSSWVVSGHSGIGKDEHDLS